MTAAADPTAPFGYLWGDDGYGIDAAIEAFRADTARFPAGAPDRLRRTVENDPGRLLGELTERLATGSMFGAGVLAIVSNPGGLSRRPSDRDALKRLLTEVAPGNGLVLVEESSGARKDPPQPSLAEVIRAAGGVVRRLEAPKEGALAAWIETRARERQVTLGPGAAREIASRVGGFVRENDVDRRQQGRIAVSELEKLALRRIDGGTVTVDDVRELVAEAIPGTMWGFTDAIGMRQRQRSLDLLERLVDQTPEPVLLAVLHRRIRELIEVADRLERGETPGSLVRSMGLAPFRAETLVRQARQWRLAELEAALEGLLDLDADVKGVGGRIAGEARTRLGFDLWIGDLVAPA
jgi:DNA polymerase-3 subunit delta